MSDLISRQAAINAIENTDCELPPYTWDELTDAIMKVPSAQPKQTDCEYCHEDSDGYVRPLEKELSCICALWHKRMGNQPESKRLERFGKDKILPDVWKGVKAWMT